jgi:uncharacterized membrane protein
MSLKRVFRHLFIPDWVALRAFPRPVLDAIEQAIGASEARHSGELRFVVETGLDLPLLWRGTTARERATQLFATLGVWDTEHNSGVLVYVQLVDRQVEILADRGIDARVGKGQWEGICARVQQCYARGEFQAGSLAALAEITELLALHFPAAGANPNELPDRPIVL